jgi:hypothetical protein
MKMLDEEELAEKMNNKVKLLGVKYEDDSI